MSDWDLNQAGNLIVHPVLGWETRKTALLGLLRLRYATSETEFESGGIGIQLHLTPIQLRTLAADLVSAADAIERAHPTIRQ